MSDAANVSSPDAERLAEQIKATPLPVEQLMQRITFIALGYAQRRTPVRTGTLRRSETTRVEPGGERGWLGTNVEYAPLVHWGVGRRKAKPFFVWGIEDARPDIDRELARFGDEHMEKVAR